MCRVVGLSVWWWVMWLCCARSPRWLGWFTSDRRALLWGSMLVTVVLCLGWGWRYALNRCVCFALAWWGGGMSVTLSFACFGVVAFPVVEAREI